MLDGSSSKLPEHPSAWQTLQVEHVIEETFCFLLRVVGPYVLSTIDDALERLMPFLCYLMTVTIGDRTCIGPLKHDVPQPIEAPRRGLILVAGCKFV